MNIRASKARNRLAPGAMCGADLTMYIVLPAEANYAPIQMRSVLPRFDEPTADRSDHAPH